MTQMTLNSSGYSRHLNFQLKDNQNGTREVIPLESDRMMKNGYDGRGVVVVGGWESQLHGEGHQTGK